MRHSYPKRSKACSVIDALNVSTNMWQMSKVFADFHHKLYSIHYSPKRRQIGTLWLIVWEVPQWHCKQSGHGHFAKVIPYLATGTREARLVFRKKDSIYSQWISFSSYCSTAVMAKKRQSLKLHLVALHPLQFNQTLDNGESSMQQPQENSHALSWVWGYFPISTGGLPFWQRIGNKQPSTKV